MYGKHHSEETKRKLSEKNKGQVFSEERNKKVSASTFGGKNHRARKVKCIETGEIFEYILKAVKKYPKASKIAEVCNGTRKTAGGLHWEWA